MKLDLYRFSSGENDTLGILYVDGRFCCFTLEDEHRGIKVRGETRIPAGTYEVRHKKSGRVFEKYQKRFDDAGVLEVANVPGFAGILIHIGNNEGDTDGCILVGNILHSNKFDNGFLGDSTSAYRHLYSLCLDAFDNKRGVTITLHDNIQLKKI